MKYLKQVVIILFFTMLGELLSAIGLEGGKDRFQEAETMNYKVVDTEDGTETVLVKDYWYYQ